MEQIGRYKILGEIGRGAMGVVYRAQDPAIGRTVAIKTIRLNELADPSEHAKLRDRLLREAQSAGILSHPGIVTIFDVSEEGGLAYIAMECIEGRTLERLLVTDPPDGRLILDILTQTAAALDYAHKRGIVHRDIKPANIMVHDGATAKIADFGVARIQSHQMTQAGSMVGTPNYMSPEQIQGQQVDGRSDQFSLAVIAYELLTGEKPFTGESIPALAFKIVQEDPLPVHRLNPTLDWPVDTVLRRALAKNPQDRYPTCSDFVVAVENACRTSKGWKPITPGSLQNSPTLAVSPPLPTKQVKDKPVVDTTASTSRVDDPEDTDTPAFLRWARSFAMVALGAALIGGALIGALGWLGNDVPPSATSVRDETVGEPQTEYAKPSPMPAADPPAQPAETRPEATQSSPQSPADAAQPLATRTAPVRLVTNPPGARLVIDGDEGSFCTAPCTLDLKPGRHTIAATLDGYRRTLKIFEAPGNSDVFLNLDRTVGNVIVRSEPRGATIVVDGQTQSEKTPVMLTLPTGPHKIEIVQDNHRESHEVVVRESVIANLTVNLQ
jgi:serine/threonine protein kinase